MSDPMQYLQAREHAEHEFGAQYDDIRERYAAERLDMWMYDASEEAHHEYMNKVYMAGFGDDWFAYEAHHKQLVKDMEDMDDHNE